MKKVLIVSEISPRRIRQRMIAYALNQMQSECSIAMNELAMMMRAAAFKATTMAKAVEQLNLSDHPYKKQKRRRFKSYMGKSYESQ